MLSMTRTMTNSELFKLLRSTAVSIIKYRHFYHEEMPSYICTVSYSKYYILRVQKNVSWCYTAHLRHFVPLTVFRCSEQYMKKDKTSTLLEIFPSHPTFTANGNTKCDGWIVSQEQQPSSDIDHSRIQFWPSDLLRPDQTELCLSLW